MSLTFSRFERQEAEQLAHLLISEDWPFHSGGTPSKSDVLNQITHGEFDQGTSRTYWVLENGDAIGIVRLKDVGDGTPLFDLRLRASHRGRGLGTQCVRWLTNTVFQEFPDLGRLEATTRQDNVAMRRVLVRCGYVKEAHYRQAWPSQDGRIMDSVGYAILRSDWIDEVTTLPDWNDSS